MPSLLETIQDADSREAIMLLKNRMKQFGPSERAEIMRYLMSTWASDISKVLFGMDSLDIEAHRQPIVTPSEKPIYTGEHRDTWGLEMQKLSRQELSFLLRSFITHEQDRGYIISLVFYKHNFLNKKLTDILEHLKNGETLFRQTFPTRIKTLTLVEKDKATPSPEATAANDAHFTPLVDRIEKMEPWYFQYLHHIYLDRLHFAESLFCRMVAELAELTENQVWAMDPTMQRFFTPEHLEDKMRLLQSICEFHVTLDPHFPLLHKYIRQTVAAWILIYKGYSSPAEKTRQYIGNGFLRELGRYNDTKNTLVLGPLPPFPHQTK